MRLKRWDWAGPALARRRRGKGFSYLDEQGARVEDPTTLERISGLVIPPAWEDVRICPWPNGHLQAVGTDDAGRRQYLYHEQWRRRRDREKYRRVRSFGCALPEARIEVNRHLATRGLNRRRVLAAAVTLLDIGAFRIGNEEYVESNDTYGLATVICDHVDVRRGSRIAFDYPSKAGRQRVQVVADRATAGVVRALLRRRDSSDSLLACYEGRRWHPLRSTDINEYLAELMGDDFTAKDFRTWHANVLAAVALAVRTPASTKTARRRAEADAMREVAEHLGNTPAVCRASYVDPALIDAFREGRTIDPAIADLGPLSSDPARGAAEQALLELLPPP